MTPQRASLLVSFTVAACGLLASYLSISQARSTMRETSQRAGWENDSMTIQSQTICFTRYPHWHIAASANLSPGDEQPIAWRHCLKLNGRSIASYSNFATQMTGEPPYCALAQAEW